MRGQTREIPLLTSSEQDKPPPKTAEKPTPSLSSRTFPSLLLSTTRYYGMETHNYRPKRKLPNPTESIPPVLAWGFLVTWRWHVIFPIWDISPNSLLMNPVFDKYKPLLNFSVTVVPYSFFLAVARNPPVIETNYYHCLNNRNARNLGHRAYYFHCTSNHNHKSWKRDLVETVLEIGE